MQEPCSRPLLPRRGRLRRGTARMRGLAINSILRGQGLYNRYNAVLERVLGNKGPAVMTVPELDAARCLSGGPEYGHPGLTAHDGPVQPGAGPQRPAG